MPRILIADDNPLSLRFFEDVLRAAGHDCTCVGNGLDAVAAVSARHFDLLLFDARMPGLDGPGALQRIRTNDHPSRDCPALATTADNDATSRERLLAAGFAEVLPKPLAAATLRAAVAAHLRVALDPAVPLDDARALSAAGGDVAIVAALRDLLAGELSGLPEQVECWARERDFDALRECLHRLDASAGFCGASALADAIAQLRAAQAESHPAWPEVAIAKFLAACETLHTDLARSSQEK